MNVLVTGGSRGIGRATVERFACDGHRVVFTYCHHPEEAKALEKATGTTAVFMDLFDVDSIHTAYKNAVHILGSVDVLVNNAGVSHIGLFTDGGDDELLGLIQADLTSHLLLSRDATVDMVKNHRGVIVNVGSVWGRVGASCEVVYATAKAGLRGFTMSLAKELGPSGIRVNGVEPGVIETDMNAHFDAETVSDLCDETPLCRLGKPGEVADLICYLASDKASFITGQMIGVDGGFGL